MLYICSYFKLLSLNFDLQIIQQSNLCLHKGFKTIEVMEGRADVYLHTTSIKKWDTCAPDALLHVSGMRMTDLRGLPIEYKGSEDFLNENGLMASRGIIPDKFNHFSFLKALKGDD